MNSGRLMPPTLGWCKCPRPHRPNSTPGRVSSFQCQSPPRFWSPRDKSPEDITCLFTGIGSEIISSLYHVIQYILGAWEQELPFTEQPRTRLDLKPSQQHRIIRVIGPVSETTVVTGEAAAPHGWPCPVSSSQMRKLKPRDVLPWAPGHTGPGRGLRTRWDLWLCTARACSGCTQGAQSLFQAHALCFLQPEIRAATYLTYNRNATSWLFLTLA